MNLKQILVTSAAALALSIASIAMAETESSFVSGEVNPVDEGDAAQLKAPVEDYKAQDKTEAMLKKEAGLLSGDTNPVDEGDAAQLKAPK